MDKTSTNTTSENGDHLIGIFSDRGRANQAINRLYTEGFSHEDLSLIVSARGAEGHFGFTERSKVAEGATAGGSIGVGLGALAGALAAVGAIALPGAGVVAAGPIVAALAGAGAGGATGGFVGGLVGLGFSETQAEFFEQEVERGHILLAVKYGNEDQRKAIEAIFFVSDAKQVA
jgi:hypothetical protein